MRPAGRLDITPSAMQRADSVSSTMSQFAAGRARAQAARVAIIDNDIHNGNGTQSIFYHRPDVFFVSVHRDWSDFLSVTPATPTNAARD